MRGVTGERTSQPRDYTSDRPLVHETPVTSVGDQERKSIAILPFRNVSNDPQSSFYEFSLADAVITELARLRSLVVRPSSEIVKYQGIQFDPRQAGREMSVSAVLSAGFLRAGDRMRVTAQLIDVESGELIWSDRIDADASDIINVQDTITQEICDGLRLELTSDEKDQLERAKTANAEAYEAYLRGRDALGRFIYHTIARKDIDEAIGHFERAAYLDPSFALAHSALGKAYSNRVIKGTGEPGDYDAAMEAFDKALAIDPNLLEPDHPLIKAFRAQVLFYRGEHVKAAEILEQVLEQQPQLDGIRPIYSGFLSALGFNEEARAQLNDEVKKTADTDHDVSYWLASAYAMEGERDEALRWLRRAIELGNENKPWFERNPSWDSLKDDPEFQEIIGSIKTPAAEDHA